MVGFLAFALVCPQLVSASSHSIHVCRDVCAKTATCALLQQAIMIFACHRTNHDHEDNSEILSHSNQNLASNKGIECIKPCTLLLVNSTMKTQVNKEKMAPGALNTKNRNHNHVSRDEQRGEKIRRRNFEIQGNVQTQNAKRLETGDGGRDETELTSSPLGKPGHQKTKPSTPPHTYEDQHSATWGRTTGVVNESTATSTSHNNDNQNSSTKEITRGGVNEARATSPPTSTISVPNQGFKRKTASRRIQKVTKSSVKGRGSKNESNTNPPQGASVQVKNREREKADQFETNNTPKLESKITNMQKVTSNSQPREMSPTISESDEDISDKKTKQKIHPSRPDYDVIKVGKTMVAVKKYAVKKTWKKALEQCQADGGTLVKLNTHQKYRSLSKKYAFFKSHWIGLTDLYDNDTFFWIDGEPLTFTKWQNGEPHHVNENGNKENCADLSVHFFKGQGWADQPCHKLFQFICEL